MDKRELVTSIAKYLRNKYTGKVTLTSRSAIEPKVNLCCEPELKISNGPGLKSGIKDCLKELNIPIRENESIDATDMVLLENKTMILFTICEPESASNKSKKAIIILSAC